MLSSDRQRPDAGTGAAAPHREITVSISLKPQYLKRFAAVALLLIKHGREDWVKQMGLDAALRDHGDRAPVASGKAEELAKDLESLGPTFVKLGQLLSGRADLLPPAYLEALSRLQDDVAPFRYEEVESIITEDLGVRLSRAFSEFDPRPLASASLGQVHMARLRDGEQVVVKVQRPGIREEVVLDFDALQSIAEFIDEHTEFGKAHQLRRHLEELRKSVLNELDYRLEATNLETLRRNLAGFETLVVPRPINGLCSSRVLTMEHISGAKVTDVSPVVLMEVDGPRLTRELFQAYLKQLMVDGFFHADPHPGNVLLTDDRRIALLDLGMVGRITPELQQGLLKMVLAISEKRGEDAADEATRLADRIEGADRHAYRRLIADVIGQRVGDQIGSMQVGRVLLDIQRVSGQNGFRLPSVFTMVGKMLLNLDRIAKVLDPSFDPNAAVRANAVDLMRMRMKQNFSVGHLLQTALETNEFVQMLPQRLNAMMDAFATRELRVRVDAIDEEHLLKGLHKIANRITTGLVLAALIIGAALLMRVETSFRIAGYPGLAMLLFAAATAGALILVFRVARQDRRHESEVGHSRKPKS